MIEKNELFNILKEKGQLIFIDIGNKNKFHSYNPLEGTIIDDINNKNDTNFIQTLEELGFEGEDDFYQCIYNVDLTIEDNRRKFELWKRDNGTKQGLLEI